MEATAVTTSPTPDAARAGVTAPGCGLTLVEVIY